MKVLVVCNTIDFACWGSADLVRAIHEVVPARVLVRRGPHQDLGVSPREFDRIVISGSKTSALEEAQWISELDQFLLNAMEQGVPVLGVCYGHQTLARVLGGRNLLQKAAVPELGWIEVRKLADTPLFEGLDSPFYTVGSHYDEVHALPPGARRIAESDRCSIQAFDVPGRSIYGIQFHPEKNLDEAKKFEKEVKERGEGHLFLGAGKAERLYQPEVSRRIFWNFLK